MILRTFWALNIISAFVNLLIYGYGGQSPAALAVGIINGIVAITLQIGFEREEKP